MVKCTSDKRLLVVRFYLGLFLNLKAGWGNGNPWDSWFCNAGSTPAPAMIIMNLFSPLEQFEVTDLISFKISGIKFIFFSNINLFLVLLFFITFFLYLDFISIKLIPNTFLKSFLISILNFIENLLKENVTSTHRFLQVYFPYIFVIFFFVLQSNFIGMIPYSFTLTSSLMITFSLALGTFIGLNIIGLLIHKFSFLALFLPPGTPTVIAPFIVCIEFISYIARVFSLSIRLFANMMAGHTLLKILAGFTWTMLSVGGIWLLISIFPTIIIFIVTILELAVAFLQTYVFTVLLCLYLRDVTSLH